jgi:hypothetical protein
MTLTELSPQIRRGFAVSASMAICASLQIAQAADVCPGQDVSSHQAVTAFNSLMDGQPGAPRTLQLTVIPSYDVEDRALRGQLTVERVVATSGFWCQAQLALSGPSLDVDESSIDSDKSVTAGWQQRWLIDDGSLPTVSTVISVQIPYDEPDAKTDIVLTGIVAKSMQWGAVYLNAFAETTDGADSSSVDFGGVVGAKRVLNGSLALFADIAIREGGAYALELSAERDFNNGLSLGPGIALSHAGDGSNGVDVAIDMVIFKVFGSQ